MEKELKMCMKYTVGDKIVHKFLEKTAFIRGRILQKKLNNKDFTCIANNCWGGVLYENFALQKNSPTVGGYFFADDYIRFVENLRYYLSLEPRMGTVFESRHKDDIYKMGSVHAAAPVGFLDDVEFIFLHYRDEKTAKEKWLRRCRRVNYNNLIFKFSNMYNCTGELLTRFDTMNLPGKKIMFVNQPNHNFQCGIYVPGFDSCPEILNDTFYWNKYFNVSAFLNKGEIQRI